MEYNLVFGIVLILTGVFIVLAAFLAWTAASTFWGDHFTAATTYIGNQGGDVSIVPDVDFGTISMDYQKSTWIALHHVYSYVETTLSPATPEVEVQ